MLTVAALAADLNRQLGPFALLVDVPSACAWAMREIGYRTADPMAITDDDLTCVCDDDINKLIGVANYGASERVYSNLDPVQLRAAGIDEDAEVLRRMWKGRIDHLLSTLKARYAYGLAPLTEGELDLHFEAPRDGWQRRDDPRVDGW